MKYLIILALLTVNNAFSGQIKQFKQLNTNSVEKISQIIYKLEGGSHTKYPFGIKSINTNGDYNKSKQICINTIQNHYIRWQKWGKTNEFLNSLADRYCPPSIDKKGNTNWKKNIQSMLDAETKKEFNR